MNVELNDYKIFAKEPQDKDDYVLVFNARYFYVNQGILNHFGTVTHVRILFDRNNRRIVLEPCTKNDKDSFRWCSFSERRQARRICSQEITYTIFEIMGWDYKECYQVPGEIQYASNQQVLMFELDNARAREKKRGELLSVYDEYTIIELPMCEED